MDWGKRKGLDVFVRLSKDLKKDYQVVLVGTNDEIDSHLPNEIISIHRTSSQKELAEIYSSADMFVNPTREDTFPTVNIESLACGTPVLTYNTGGSPEILTTECGVIVEKDNYNSLKKSIVNMKKKSIISDECIKRSKDFNCDEKFNEYIELFKDISKRGD